MNNRRPGNLRERVVFARRGDLDDGFGNIIPGAGPFEDQFTVAGHLHPLKGGEEVFASRLTGVQPFVLTIRQSSATADITIAWRVTDARNPNRVYGVTAPPVDPDGRNAWLEMIVTEGAPE